MCKPALSEVESNFEDSEHDIIYTYCMSDSYNYMGQGWLILASIVTIIQKGQ